MDEGCVCGLGPDYEEKPDEALSGEGADRKVDSRGSGRAALSAEHHLSRESERRYETHLESLKDHGP